MALWIQSWLGTLKTKRDAERFLDHFLCGWLGPGAEPARFGATSRSLSIRSSKRNYKGALNLSSYGFALFWVIDRGDRVVEVGATELPWGKVY
jgi:hypothetical protein